MYAYNSVVHFDMFWQNKEPIKKTCTYTDLWEVNQLSDSDFGFLKLDIDYKEEQEIWLAEAAVDESRLEQVTMRTWLFIKK